MTTELISNMMEQNKIHQIAQHNIDRGHGCKQRLRAHTLFTIAEMKNKRESTYEIHITPSQHCLASLRTVVTNDARGDAAGTLRPKNSPAAPSRSSYRSRMTRQNLHPSLSFPLLVISIQGSDPSLTFQAALPDLLVLCRPERTSFCSHRAHRCQPSSSYCRSLAWFVKWLKNNPGFPREAKVLGGWGERGNEHKVVCMFIPHTKIRVSYILPSPTPHRPLIFRITTTCIRTYRSNPSHPPHGYCLLVESADGSIFILGCGRATALTSLLISNPQHAENTMIKIRWTEVSKKRRTREGLSIDEDSSARRTKQREACELLDAVLLQ